MPWPDGFTLILGHQRGSGTAGTLQREQRHSLLYAGLGPARALAIVRHISRCRALTEAEVQSLHDEWRRHHALGWGEADEGRLAELDARVEHCLGEGAAAALKRALDDVRVAVPARGGLDTWLWGNARAAAEDALRAIGLRRFAAEEESWWLAAPWWAALDEPPGAWGAFQAATHRR